MTPDLEQRGKWILRKLVISIPSFLIKIKAERGIRMKAAEPENLRRWSNCTVSYG